VASINKGASILFEGSPRSSPVDLKFNKVFCCSHACLLLVAWWWTLCFCRLNMLIGLRIRPCKMMKWSSIVSEAVLEGMRHRCRKLKLLYAKRLTCYCWIEEQDVGS
jgi:hypothetical protein